MSATIRHRQRWIPAVVSGCALLAFAPQRGVVAQGGSLDELLGRAGTYVQDYERSFAAVVSRERYVQRVRSGGVEMTRNLSSEVALVAVAGDDWLVFRDVHVVDGQVVGDRDDRLATLFLKPAADLGTQVRRITQESARFNLGPANRLGINTPTQALEFVRRENQRRSNWRLGSRRTIEGVETRELRFDERVTPRLIRTPDDAPARGAAWVVPATGAVVRTEVRLDSADVSASITVTYSLDQKLGLRVPVRMTETYDVRGAETLRAFRDEGLGARAAERVTIEARATYSDFRAFSVSTAEIIR